VTGVSVDFQSALVAGLLSGTLISAVLALITRGYSLRQESKIQDQFRHVLETRQSRWALLQEVLGPVCAHLARTSLAFRRWHEKNLYLEQHIIGESNSEIRKILLAKYHLLTPELRIHAMSLIQHYDRWLEEFEMQRRTQNPAGKDSAFVFTGPQGYPFPAEAERAFVAALDETYRQLAAPSEGEGQSNLAAASSREIS
jgi:hypothetical protein